MTGKTGSSSYEVHKMRCNAQSSLININVFAGLFINLFTFTDIYTIISFSKLFH